MSTTVDQRVVEMQFDNRNFEHNVSESMSTIEKLKKALNFKGAEKGFNELEKASKKVDMSVIGNAIETIKVKFSALQVVAIATLTNITNSAINTGKTLIKSLSVDQISAGFKEYELKLGSVQTIMASTGETLETVSGYLEELNDYADKTIYSFSDMTSNIGKFTNAGVKLNDAVAAIQGISNVAAVSGANADEASRAMYNFAQALSSGAVKLIDWKSIENANMATVEFKNHLLETAASLGTVTKTADGMYKTLKGNTFSATKNFNEVLQDQWMTSDVLVKTLSLYSDETTEIGKKAFAAAQDVKTFTQLLDTLKEAVGSGWATTWENLFGNLNEAKELWTEVSNVFGGMIKEASDNRNAILSKGLNSNWSELKAKITEAGISSQEFDRAISNALTKNGKNVSRILDVYGTFENAFTKGFLSSAEATKILNEALGGVTNSLFDLSLIKDDLTFGETGDDIKQAQQALKTLGYDLGKFGEQADGIDGIFGKVTQSAVKAFQTANNLKVTGIVDKETLAALNAASTSTESLAGSCDDLLDGINSLSGRAHLVNALNNAFYGLKTSIDAIKQAWNDIFYPGATDEDIIKIKAERVYNLALALDKLSVKLILSEETSKKLVRTFKGLFAILDIIKTITGGALKIAIKAICKLFGVMDVDILDVTAAVGDAIVAFRDWLLNNQFVRALDHIVALIGVVIKVVRDLINEFLEIPEVKSAIAEFNDVFSDTFYKLQGHLAETGKRFSEFIKRVMSMKNIKLADIGNIFKDFRDNVLGYFIDVDGKFVKLKDTIKSFGENIRSNFADAGTALGKFKNITITVVSAIGEAITKYLGAILTITFGVAFISTLRKIADALEFLGTPIKALMDFSKGVTGVLESLAGAIDAYATETESKAIKNFAISFAIFVASFAGMVVLVNKYGDDTNKAMHMLAVLSASFLIISAILGKINIGETSVSLIGLTGALLLLIFALKQMENLDSNKLWGNIGALGVIAAGLLVAVVGFAAVAAIMAKATREFAPDMLKFAVFIIAIAASLKLIASSLSDMEQIEVTNIPIVALVGVVGGLILLSAACSKLSTGSAASILAIAVAVKILVEVLYSMSKFEELNPHAMMESLVVIFSLMGMLALVMRASQLAGKYAVRAGKYILGISVGLLAIAAAMKILSSMSPEETLIALFTVKRILAAFAPLVALSIFAGDNAAKAGLMFAGIGASMVLLSAAMFVMSKLDPSGLVIALGAISVLMILFGGLIAASKLAGDATKTLIVLTIAVTGIAIALAALSFIDEESLVRASLAMGGMIALFGGLIMISQLAANSEKSLLTIIAMTLVIAALTACVIAVAKLTDDTNDALNAAKALSMLALSMSGACVLLELAGASAAGIGIGLAAFVVVLGLVTAIMIGFGAICDNNPGIEKNIDKGIAILNKIAYGVGSFVGNIIGGLSDGIFAGLPAIGTYLGDFMTNAKPFIDGIKEIKSDCAEGAMALAKTILVLTASGCLDAIVSWLTKSEQTPLETLGDTLGGLGDAMAKFAEKVSDLTPEQIASIKNAAEAGKAMVELVDALPKEGGLLEGIFGKRQDFKKFGENLCDFGSSLVAYAGAISDLTPEKILAIEDSARAGQALVDVVNAIPSEGGVVSWFTGDKDMDDFADGVKSFAKGLKVYGDYASNTNNEAIISSKDSAMALVDIAKEIPNTGGVVSWFTGNNDMDVFANGVKSFAKGLKVYGNYASNTNHEAIISSKDSAMALVDIAKEIPNTGGVVSWFTGNNDMDVFANGLKSFAKGLKVYGNYASNTNHEAIISSKEAVFALIEMVNSMENQGGVSSWFTGDNTFENFQKGLPEFGEAMATFSDKITNINLTKVKGAASAGLIIAEMSAKMSNTIFGKIGSDTPSLKVVTDGLPGLADNIREYYTIMSTINTDTLNKSTYAINNIASLLIGKIGSDTPSLKVVTDGLSGLADNIQEYYTIMSTINADTLNKSTYAINNIVSLLKGMNSIDGTGSVKFRIAMSDLALSGINSFTQVFKDSSDKINSAGQNILIEFGKGLSVRTDEFLKGFTTIGTSALDIINGYEEKFYEAGAYLVAGLINGMGSKAGDLKTASKNVGSTAYNSTAEELEIHSPSKKMMKLGRFTVEGFIIGLQNGTQKLQSTVTTAMNSAVVNPIQALSRKAYDYLVKSKKDILSLFTENEFIAGVIAGAKKFTGAIISVFNNEFLTPMDVITNKARKLLSDCGVDVSSDLLMKDVAKSMDFGSGAMKGLLMQYEELTGSLANDSDEIYRASAAVTNYGKALYMKSDYYKEDTANIKKYKDELEELKKKRAEVQKEFDKENKKAVKSMNEVATSSTETQKTVSEAVSETAKSTADAYDGTTATYLAMQSANKKNVDGLANVQEKEEGVLDTIKGLTDGTKTWKDVTSKATDKLNELTSSTGLSSDAFDKMAANMNISTDELIGMDMDFNSLADSMGITTESMGDFSQVYQDSTAQNVLASNTQADKLSSDLEQIDNDIKTCEENIKSSEDAVLEHTMQVFNEIKNTIKDSVKEYTNLLSTSLETNIDIFEKFGSDETISKQEVLDNMKSQVDGVQKWINDLANLKTRGLSDGILQELKDMGPSGAKYVAAFASMTSSELRKANDTFAKASKMTSDTLIRNFDDQLAAAEKWVSNINKLAKMDLNPAILEELAKAGVDSAEYVEAFLTMTPEQIKSINAKYEKALKLPETAANKVMGTLVYASGEYDKAGQTYGENLCIGMANGLQTQTPLVNRAVDNMRKSVAKILTNFNNSDLSKIVITPVLDMSKLPSGFNPISAIFSARQAESISASTNSTSTNPNGANATNNSTVTYNYTQNNTSPTALNNSELYRQTDNLLRSVLRVK
jgi:tape measure domain-containing protein